MKKAIHHVCALYIACAWIILYHVVIEFILDLTFVYRNTEYQYFRIEEENQAKGPAFWKKLQLLWLKFKDFLSWDVCSGNVKFWADRWTDMGILSDFAISAQIDSDLLVKEVFSDDYMISEIPLPEDILQSLRNLNISLNEEDHVGIWTLEKSGLFSVKSAWSEIRCKRNTVSWGEGIWHKFLPSKISFFLWRVGWNRIAVDTNLRQMRICLASKCNCCVLSPQIETCEHLLFEGEWASVVWRLLSEEFQLGDISRGSFANWFNYVFSTKSRESSSSIFRRLMVAVALWEIWRERCLSRFEESSKNSVKNINFRVADWRIRFQKLLNGAVCFNRLDYKSAERLNLNPKMAVQKELEVIKWNKPLSGLFKINCDGASDVMGQSGGGAVIRDDNGDLVAAASWYYGKNSAVAAEVLALRDGLRLAQDLGIPSCQLMIEVDSLLLINSLKQGSSLVWNQRTNWKEILSRVHEIHSVEHVFRELNMAADLLAKRGRIIKRNDLFWSSLELPKKVARVLFWEKHEMAYLKRR